MVATTGDRNWFSGAVQSALDKTVNKKKMEAPNQPFRNKADFIPKLGESHWIKSRDLIPPERVNFYGENQENLPVAAGIPGWVLQSDVLRPLTPILSARSDTLYHPWLR